MLPDYPKIKERLLKIYSTQMKETSWKSYLLSKINRIVLHEGDRIGIVREDGSNSEIKMEKQEVHIRIPVEYITAGNHKKISEIVAVAAEEMRKKITQNIYTSISDAADSVGNTINAKGMALNPDHIYELFDKVQLDFDKNGNIKEGFEFHIHPDTIEAVKRVSQEIESDPIQKKRFDELIARKREEWRVRESNRKLVG